MKKLFSIITLCVLFTSVSFAQNAYVGTKFGFETSLDNGKNTHQALNVQLGYFFDSSQALELEYTHGFKKDFMFYNRIGANYVYEHQILHCQTSPYLKLGVGYKAYDAKRSEAIGLCDMKFGLGIHHYVSCDVAIQLGVEFTNAFNNDIDFAWRNTMCQFQIGLAYHF